MVIFFAFLSLFLITSAHINCTTNKAPKTNRSKRSSKEAKSTRTCNSSGKEDMRSTGENSKPQPESNLRSRDSTTNNATTSPSDLKFDMGPSEPSEIKTNLDSLQGDLKPNPLLNGRGQGKKLGAGARDLLPSQSNKNRNKKPVLPPGSDIIYPSIIVQKTQRG